MLRLMSLLLAFLLIALVPIQSSPASLRPILLLNGETPMPCDSQWHWVAIVPVNAYVTNAYLFGSVYGGGTGIDAGIWSPSYGGWGVLADVHVMQMTPTGNSQGQGERSFQPDSVWVTDVYVGGYCGGGGEAYLFAEIFVRDFP